jgi:hypothetical protein
MKLQLANPLKFMQINQKFGQNANNFYRRQGMPGHNGIDYFAPHGTPIYASHDGFASYQVDNAGGHGVVIITDKEYEDVNGELTYWKTIYWHLVDFLREPQYKSPIADKTGFVKVKTGDLIGFANNTGQSTGSHLHFGLKPVAKGENWGTWYNTEQNNGFYGAVDPAPYMNTPKEVFTRIMRRGQENQDIIKLQSFFLRTGYMKPISRGFGVYGPATQAAVKQFQIDNGIKHNNGVQVGTATLQALNKKYDL